LIFILLLIAGCKTKPRFTPEELAAMPLVQRDGLPEASGGFSLSVAGETITADEIVRPLVEPVKAVAQSGDFQTFQSQSRFAVEKLITNRISNILLYQEAKKQAGDQIDDALDKAADAEVRKFIASYGGDYAKSEDALEQMQMDWKSFKEEQKKIIMSHSYISSRIKEEKPVTYGQMLENYEKVKAELFARQAMIKFSLIDVQPALVEIADPNKTRIENARDLAAALTGRLSRGEDFAELAKKYSKDYRSTFGGSWNAVNPDSLAQPYDILAREAREIQSGQIAGPIETEGHIFIMKLEEKHDLSYEPFENVQKQILANIDFERRRQAVEKVSKELIQRAAVAATDEFVTHCLQRLYVLARQ
jgi:parvulin-like peptidyl-prolyl isomerase